MKNKSPFYRTSLPFELLKSLTEKELHAFEKLISSGYLSIKKGLDTLLKALKKYALDRTDFTPDIQCIIYNILFSKEQKAEGSLNNFQKKKLSKIMNELLHAAEKFLMFEKIKSTDEHDTLLLFPELIDRKQQMLYSKRIKAKERKLDKIKKQGIDYHNQCYHIQSEKARFLFINNVLAKEDNYDELQYHVDIKYLLQKLQYHLAKITLQRRYAHKTFNLNSFTSLEALLCLPEYQTNPLIQLFVLNIQLVEAEEEATFLALSKLLKEKQEVIPSDFLKPFYINVTNYCIYQVSKGDLNYNNYLFEVYNSMHEANLLVMSNTIELALLKNIITNACRVQAFEWAIDKLHYYVNYLPISIRTAVFEYNSGIIAFSQQNYETALTHFNKVIKIDDAHELSLRITQLQCFYEIDISYENYTQQLIDSLRTYIHQNKKLAKRRKTGYFNFILVFKKLYKLKNILDKPRKKMVLKKELPKLKIRLLQFELIILKQWLLSKINDMENSI